MRQSYQLSTCSLDEAILSTSHLLANCYVRFWFYSIFPLVETVWRLYYLSLDHSELLDVPFDSSFSLLCIFLSDLIP